MKTLADLKRDYDKYEWSLLRNSWFKEVPDFMQDWRRVSIKGTHRFALKTYKDGLPSDSWLDFPYARELKITPFGEEISHEFGAHIKMYEGYFILEIERNEDNNIHTMTYLLRPIAETI